MHLLGFPIPKQKGFIVLAGVTLPRMGEKGERLMKGRPVEWHFKSYFSSLVG